MNILLTGGTGLIGRHLLQQLAATPHNVTVVSRSPDRARARLGDRWDYLDSLSKLTSLDDFQAVINLAGAPIAEGRWSQDRKQQLCESRWQITERLSALCHASTRPPAAFISGSAVGYYGNKGVQAVNEQTPAADGFTHRLCARWEALALGAQSPGTRVCLLRTGAVLAPDGGMLAKLLPLFRSGLGGPLGSGEQYLPWIHIDDMVGGILWLLNHPLSGPFNMTAPTPATNETFSKILGQTLRRPSFMRAPAFAVRVIMGEAAALVLDSQRAVPEKLSDSGFQFRWPELRPALEDIVQRRS